MMPIGLFAAPLVRAYCAPRAIRFGRALSEVKGAQEATLARIVTLAACTNYGRSLGLAPGDGVAEFRNKIPVLNYAALAPWIERQRTGEENLLTPGRIRCHEPTSGSSGSVKRIPYNDALLSSFQSMFAIWAHDLLSRRLALRSGRSFISISFSSRQGGFDDDRDYLSGILRAVVGRFLVLPSHSTEPEDAQAFRDRLALALAASADLEVISIWNPSYLLVLLEHIFEHRERLLPLLPPVRRSLFEHQTISWTRVWPRLQLISCWTNASATVPAAQLHSLFPHVFMQGKGLLATEAPVTLPLVDAGGCVPLVDEVFIELKDEQGALCLLHEAKDDTEYEVIVTQAGGLLRYCLGDRVLVHGKYCDAPRLRFIGRADAVCDMTGEKMAEDVVAALLKRLSPAGFSTLVPVMEAGRRPHYCLLTDCMAASLAQELEEGLQQSYRYREARMLGQLDRAQVLMRSDMRSALHNTLILNGFKAGDIKDRALIPSLELAAAIWRHMAADQREPM